LVSQLLDVLDALKILASQPRLGDGNDPTEKTTVSPHSPYFGRMNTRDAYRAFCRDNPDMPVFLQDWYLDACCQGGSWDAALLAREGVTIAAWPYFLKRKGPWRYVTMPPFVKWMGPWLRAPFRDERQVFRHYAQLLDQLPTISAFKQSFSPQATNWLPFYWRSYRQTTRYTYDLAIENLDAVYDGINRNMRRNIKKAESLLEVRQEENLDELYRLNRLSFARQGLRPPYSLDLLRKHDAALAAHEARASFFAVDAQERVHSAAYLIWDRHSAYYHLSGDDPALRASGAGPLLIWAAIRHTREKLGLSRFDFEGSMLAPVEAIRRQFGAMQTPYFFLWKYDDRLYWALDALRGKLPR
jgi:hypothetical protein